MAKYIEAEQTVATLRIMAKEHKEQAHGDPFEVVYAGAIAGVADTIDMLPAVDIPRWIPVTERLPEEEGQYLVSCDTDYGVEVGRFYIDEDGERYFGCDWNDPEDIEAWMPLPEHYKGGEEE